MPGSASQSIRSHLSDPTVRVKDFDGLAPDGTPYYIFTSLVAGGTLSPSGLTGSRTLAFLNPAHVQFTYDLVFLGQLNRNPIITTTPVIEALAGRPYVYAVGATDPDGDPVTFSLVTS